MNKKTMNLTPVVRVSIRHVSGRVEIEFLKLPTSLRRIFFELSVMVQEDPRIELHNFPYWVTDSRGLHGGFWLLYKPEWETVEPKVTQASIEQGNNIARKCLNVLVSEGLLREDIEVTGNIHRM